MITTPQVCTGEHQRPVSSLHRWPSATGFVLCSRWASATGFVLASLEQGRNWSRMLTCAFLWCCDHGLACWSMLFFLSIDSLWFPARRCNISGTLVVPLVVFVIRNNVVEMFGWRNHFDQSNMLSNSIYNHNTNFWANSSPKNFFQTIKKTNETSFFRSRSRSQNWDRSRSWSRKNFVVLVSDESVSTTA